MTEKYEMDIWLGIAYDTGSIAYLRAYATEKEAYAFVAGFGGCDTSVEKITLPTTSKVIDNKITFMKGYNECAE